MAKPPSNEYFTPVKKRTSIGRSPRSRPKNKNKRRQYVKEQKQKTSICQIQGARMTKIMSKRKSRQLKENFKVYPSAYANAYASKICAGKIKDPSGVKRKDFKGT